MYTQIAQLECIFRVLITLDCLPKLGIFVYEHVAYPKGKVEVISSVRKEKKEILPSTPRKAPGHVEIDTCLNATNRKIEFRNALPRACE